jgi:hypothetical protein
MSARALLPRQLGGSQDGIPPPVNDTATTRQVLRGERDPRDEVVVWKDNQPRGGTTVGFLDDLYNKTDKAFGGLLPGGSSPTAPGGLFGPSSPLAPIGNWLPSTPPVPWTGGSLTPGGVGAGVLSGQLPLITDPIPYQGLKAPKGYTLVRNGNETVAILSVVAYALGIKKRPQKSGGISGREIAAAKRVQRVIGGLTVNRQPRMKLKAGKKGGR